MLSKKYSLWNACTAIDRIDGRSNWERTLLIANLFKHIGVPCPCINNEEYGVFGETPLHLLLLFNNAKNETVCDAFFDLWKLCHQSVRVKTYSQEPYFGENVLHIAIVRGYGERFVERLLKEPGADQLLEHRAKGQFFKNPELSGGYYTMLGETPLGFAACSGDHVVFSRLFDRLSKQEVQDFRTESEGYGLLHLVVLSSASKDLRTGKPAADVQAIDMLERVLAAVRNKVGTAADAYQPLTTGDDKDGHTPLSLAAAKGSVDMFRRVFDRELLATLWVYNSVHCKKMFLKGIDVDLDNPEDGRSLLETLVRYRRQDILHHSHINELVEAKWDMYGREIFYRELLVTSLFAVAAYLLPMTKYDSHWAWRASHTFSHAVVALASRGMCYSRVKPTALQLFVLGEPDAGSSILAAAANTLFAYPRWMLEEGRAAAAAIAGPVAAAVGAALGAESSLRRWGAAAWFGGDASLLANRGAAAVRGWWIKFVTWGQMARPGADADEDADQIKEG